jgi:hypothetical protein
LLQEPDLVGDFAREVHLVGDAQRERQQQAQHRQHKRDGQAAQRAVRILADQQQHAVVAQDGEDVVHGALTSS